MDQTRRDFIGRTLMAGAGATLVTSLPAAGENGTAAQVDPGVDLDPGFIAGSVVDSRRDGILSVVDLDSQVRQIRVHSATGAWKDGRYNQDRIQPNDCVFARGIPDASGVLQADWVWANIVSLRAQVQRVDPTRLELQPERLSKRNAAVIDRTLVSNADGSEAAGEVSAINRGDWVQVIAFSDPVSGALTASSIFSLMADPRATPPVGATNSAGARSRKRQGPEARAAFVVDRTGVTSWFCCGGVNTCGSSGCGGSGPGACASTWPCRSDLRAMAWPKLSNGCGPFCGGCCLSSGFPRHACGSLLDFRNPCIGTIVTVRIRDCGPTIRCVSPKCNGYNHVAYDMTPCAFTAAGKPLSAGLQGIQVTGVHG